MFVTMLALGLGLTQLAAQEQQVSGTVTDENGEGLIGATVRVNGTNRGAIAGEGGAYSITVPSGNVTLSFSYMGYFSLDVEVAGRTRIDIEMEPSASTLDEILVTGYTSERKADIIGSVSVVNTKDMLTTPAGNLTSALQGRAAGVVVSGGGQPGAGAKVRVRGFTSFGNSDPLYVIDGVPTGDASKVNPQDIESIQVLKDATSASIYGARAAQGVIIITTKQGKPGESSVTYDGYIGTQTIPRNVFPELLDTDGYLEYLKRSQDPSFVHPVFGALGTATVPDRIIVSQNFRGGVSASDPRANPELYEIDDRSNVYQILETARQGTNWFDEITRNGVIQSHQLTATGGSKSASYSVGLNYFNQEGALVETGYERFSVRLNTTFKPTDWFRVGENFQIINEDFLNGGNVGEGGAWAQSFRMVPYIPVQDIGGGWGGNGVGESGNGTNPVAQLARQRDNIQNNWKIFGNAFAELEPIPGLVFRSSFGIDHGSFFNKTYVYTTYERAENVGTIGLQQSNTFNTFWTWTNTARYSKEFGRHQTGILLGTEAVKGFGDGIFVNTNTFDFEDPLFITLNTDLATLPVVNSTNFRQSLASVFGRFDYSFDNMILFNATVRRDGSSKFGIENRYGVFPAFGLGLRLSQLGGLSDIAWLNDLKLRGGWGQMGSERVVDANNQYSLFFNSIGVTDYDINRSQTSLVPGYAARSVGSSATRWETSETTNIGFDASFLNYSWDVSFNWFNNNTNDLLVRRIRNGLEPIVGQPFINIGQMRNRGFDFNVTNRGLIGNDFRYDVTVTFTRYTNEVIDIDGNPETFFAQNASRLNNVSRTQAGHPIASFYGYKIDGFFENQEDIDALQQDGAVIGGWRYEDLNGDGVITDEDRTFIGNPHPDFIAGFNIAFQYKNFDFNSFFVWNYGNDLYNYTKYFTDMRVFVGGVSPRVLENGWMPGADNSEAVLPRLAPGTENGYTSFTSSTSNDYYVEDGSFFRARTVQLGYTLPSGIGNGIGLNRTRFYVQGQNLFTITSYQGADPDINIQGSDLLMGVDQTNYPNTRQFLVGATLTF